MIGGAISWAITALVVALALAFVLYLVGLRSLPTAYRPRTPTYNRLGDFIGARENPDYRENPEADPAAEPEEQPPAEQGPERPTHPR
ncbi:MAG: hypothetical protein ACYDAG_01885, partial [Chloroflexota bacterium]